MLRKAGRPRMEGVRSWMYASHRQRSATAGNHALDRKRSMFDDLDSINQHQNKRTFRHGEKRDARLLLDGLEPLGQKQSVQSPLDDLTPFSKRPRPAHPAASHFSEPRAASPPGVVHGGHRSNRTVAEPVPSISEEDVIPYFESQASIWASRPSTTDRLSAYGIPDGDASRLLNRFCSAVKAGHLSNPENFTFYQLDRFAQPHEEHSIDIIFTTTFFWWAAQTETQKLLENEVESNTFGHIQRLVDSADRSFPADEFPYARLSHRKIIMHVGPTNSGKTHHALRALAAAKTGCYAGPLRLLAHEIFERLNTGQIVPLGAEPPPPSTDPKTAAAARMGNPAFARACNMVTGEEQKFVDGAELVSCTVEMLFFKFRYDVAVIDEIQMIGDSDRGNGWLNAVVGIDAAEVHLCGEETAVPLVKELIKNTGDEFIVNRYERLTPLAVEEKSLEGDFSKVQKGDCIVTFSRSSIFNVKRLVEEQTGMRCAVVYGRLPPEVRSEQAALFNDPDSGYDVIIGSDAIGMGLNLKIKRMIFESVGKFSGKVMAPLSVSSVKQIAGRAGRYGLHGSKADLGGTATTLHEEDLPYLKECIGQPYKALPFARIGYDSDFVRRVSRQLPPDASMATILEAAVFVGRLPNRVRYSDKASHTTCTNYLDDAWRDMKLEDRMMVLFAPVPWRDIATTKIVKRILEMHRKTMAVDLDRIMPGTQFIGTMEYMELVMRRKDTPEGGKSFTPNTASTLLLLESFHKVITFYIWMSFRNPVVYAQYTEAVELKSRLEKVLNWCLDCLSKELAKKIGGIGRTPRAIDGVKVITRAERQKERFANTAEYKQHVLSSAESLAAKVTET